MQKIVVVGSLNMDIVIETPHMPKRGETISGKNINRVSGGKGANQAYALGKLGGDVTMIGAVGKDAAGDALLHNLRSVNVDVSGIRQIENETTGQAFITVDDDGDNSIIIIAGTNGLVTKELIEDIRPHTVFNAIGAVPLIPRIPGADKAFVSNSHDVSKFSKEAISLSHSIFNSYTFIMYCIKSSIGLSIGGNSWSISYCLLIR